MRLWHEALIPKLPQKQLCGQWRECIALLGNGWGRKHSTVDYVFKHSETYLVAFTYKIYEEMIKRHYLPNVNLIFEQLHKRYDESTSTLLEVDGIRLLNDNKQIYPEHNDQYYQECIENLRKKGVEIK